MKKAKSKTRIKIGQSVINTRDLGLHLRLIIDDGHTLSELPKDKREQASALIRQVQFLMQMHNDLIDQAIAIERVIDKKIAEKNAFFERELDKARKPKRKTTRKTTKRK